MQMLSGQYTRLVVWALSRLPSERGANLVEYSLLLLLVVIVCVGAVAYVGRETPDGMSTLGSALN